MSMLRYFFEDGRNPDGEKVNYSHLFKGLNISRCDDHYKKYMGTYPVIALNLKLTRQTNFKSTRMA